MGFRFIFILTIILSFTGKSTYLSIANLEMGESEVSELYESKSSPKEESKSDFYSLLSDLIFPSSLTFSPLSIVIRSLVSSITISSCMNRGPPSFV